MSNRSLLIVPALMALSPIAQGAVNISDDVELKMSMRLQSRIEMASASDAAGDDYDVWASTTTDDYNPINMMIRRARLYLKGKYKDDINFNLTFMADEIGADDDRDPTGVDVRYAWVSKTIESNDLKHVIKFGLDKTWFISGDTDSSSRMLFATNRQTSQFNNGRQVNLAYKLKGPSFNFGFDISDDESTGASDGGDLLYSFRFETSLSEDKMMKKRKESFLGKDGFEHLLGVGFGGKSDGNDDDDDFSTFTIDYNLHMDALTLNADFVSATDKEGADVDSTAFLVQAGWAIPMDAYVFEPAARIAVIDLDTDNDTSDVFDEEGGGASGTFIDLGANFYFDGHNNKLNVGLQIFSPEEGDGDATIFRVQHQLNF